MLYFPAWKVVWVCDYDKCLWSFFRMNLLKFLVKMPALVLRLLKHVSTGLSLRAGGWEFSLATVSMSPGYFQRKQKENRRTSLLYNSPPTNCIYLTTWNFSHSPVSVKFFLRAPLIYTGTNTPIIQSLWHVPLVSVPTRFHCTYQIQNIEPCKSSANEVFT